MPTEPMPVASDTALAPVSISGWAARVGLSEALVTSLCAVYRPIVDALARRKAGLQRPLLLGVNGAQGTGKSTFLALASHMLADLHGLRVAGLSLDDLYLTRSERLGLAESVHPLLRTRGVPGTHDVALGQRVLDALTASAPAEVALPRFQKEHDDRAPKSRWPRVRTPLDIVILEGWCVGARAQDASALCAPENDLERKEDSEGVYRRYVNAQLAGPYRELFSRLDLLIMLKAPSMEAVRRFRTEQEHALRARLRAGGQADTAMSDGQVVRFVEYFERITRAMLQEMPQRADIVIEVGEDHSLLGVNLKASVEACP